MDTVRTVIIGFGGHGSKYAKLLRDGQAEGMKLTGICCRNEKGQSVIHQEYPGVTIYQNVEETFQHGEEFDAVVIVTPHNTHVPIGKMAFAAGKHVLCDKPMGISSGEGKELLKAWKEAGTAFGMIFNERTKPAFQKARELLETGALGQVSRAVWVCNTWYRTSYYHHSSPWRSSWAGEQGGLLVNQCQHYLDIWQWLFGMPDLADASIDFGKYNDFAVDDSVDIRFLYNSGFRGTFISSSGEAPGTNRLEIWGTKGRMTIEDTRWVLFDENLMDTTEFNQKNQEIFGELEHHQREIPLEEDPEPYKTVFQNFADHLQKGTPLLAPGEEGIYALELANGSYLSAWENRKISFPLDDFHYEAMLQKKIAEELDRKTSKGL
ncbi:MAG: Gfo/Idh/MocA family protein [Hungatella sp.]